MPLSRREFCRDLLGASSLALLPPEIAGKSHDDLLVEIERRACRYFFEQTDPETGMVKDRARHTAPDRHTVSSIAATGFGLSAMCIAHEYGFLPRQDALKRVQSTLEFLARRLPQEHGFFYHFVDMHTGERAFRCELSSIDTAILLLGVLHCRRYFDAPSLVQTATDIYERVD